MNKETEQDIKENENQDNEENFEQDEVNTEEKSLNKNVEKQSSSGSEIAKLQEEIDSLKQALALERADFINFRKRSSQEKSDMQTRLAGNFLSDMLPAMDAFDQVFSMRDKALQEEKEVSMQEFFKGIDLIYQQIWNVFSQSDFEEIDPIDQEFDPSSMEALGVEEREGIEHETVVQVFQKGFKAKDRILRPARVIVAKPKVSDAQISQKETNNEE